MPGAIAQVRCGLGLLRGLGWDLSRPAMVAGKGADGRSRAPVDSGQGSRQGSEAGQSYHLSASWQGEQKTHLNPRLDSINKERARELRGYQ